MLIELRIQNVAVLEDLTVSLAPGLNVLTGETGAGKSIVVDALGILLGGRASSDLVRAGADRAVVEGVLDVEGDPDVAARLATLGLEPDEGHIVLRREVAAGGRSRAWINGSPTTATIVRELSAHLVDIHGQHEHQRLLAPEYQRQVLDAFAGATGLAADVAEAFRRLRGLEEQRGALEERRRELQRRGDFIRFQLDELRGARVEDPDEDDALEAELNRLAHSEELATTTRGLHQALYGADHALSDELAAALSRLRRLETLDPTLSETTTVLQDAYHLVVDAAGRLADYGESMDRDPRRLEQLRDRRALFMGLKRKYGATLADVIRTREELEAELSELETADLDAGTLDRRVAEARDQLLERARELSQRRGEAAGGLGRQVDQVLPSVGLPDGVFTVELERLSEPAARGLESTEFVVALNPGFPPAPLSKVASGGELSRVMLALKSVLADLDRVPTLVFDEIDAGVGGAVATQVGDRLQQVARGRQVLVVTHLPQIACRAERHLFVEKRSRGGATTTNVQALEGEERVREVARMLDGEPASDASLRHARELLGQDVRVDRAG